MNNFFNSKRNIINLIASLLMLAQYLTDTDWIDPKVGALVVFVLNMILGTWFQTTEPKKK